MPKPFWVQEGLPPQTFGDSCSHFPLPLRASIQGALVVLKSATVCGTSKAGGAIYVHGVQLAMFIWVFSVLKLHI